jgi:hypothetical protein
MMDKLICKLEYSKKPGLIFEVFIDESEAYNGQFLKNCTAWVCTSYNGRPIDMVDRTFTENTHPDPTAAIKRVIEKTIRGLQTIGWKLIHSEL